MKLIYKPGDLGRALESSAPTGVPLRRTESDDDYERRTPITATEFVALREDKEWEVHTDAPLRDPDEQNPDELGLDPSDLRPAPRSSAAFGSERVRFYRPRYYVEYPDGEEPRLIVEWEKDSVLHNRRVPT